MDNNLLAKLYSLRGALSAISINKDNLDQEKQKLLQKEKSVNEKSREVANIENELNSNKYISKEVKYEKSKAFVIWALVGAMFILIAPFIIYVLSSEGVINFYDIYNFLPFLKDMNDLVVLLILMAFAEGIFMLIGLIVQLSTDIIRKHKARREINSENKRNKAQVQQNESYLTAQLTKNKTDLEKLKIEKNNKLRIYAAEKEILSASSLKSYKKLKETYASIIDPRDWKHIDLIIFYFETGRADTLKEALYQVDRQVQNDTLVEAIEQAADSISSSISTMSESLSNVINQNFASLSKQLEVQHGETMASLNKINSNLTSINKNTLEFKESIDRCEKQLTEINSTVGLQNALMSKINVDSNSLMEDVNYMAFTAPKEPLPVRESTTVNLIFNAQA